MTYYSIFIGLILIIALLLILIIMVQNPKGGGLDSSFGGGGGSQLGGVQSTNKFLDRTTWTLAISLFTLILLSNIVIKKGGSTESQINTKNIEVPAQTTKEEPANTNESTTQESETSKKETD